MTDDYFVKRMDELIKEVYIKASTSETKMYRPFHVTPKQVSILTILEDEKNIKLKVGDLAKMFQTVDSNLSSICTRLEERDFVVRERDPHDMRLIYIKITEKGKILLDKCKKKSLDRLKMCESVSVDDRVETIKALEKLSETLEKVSIL